MRSTLSSGTPVETATPSDGRAPARGLVLIPDIMGLRPLFDEHAQRLADDNGWAVAAVEPVGVTGFCMGGMFTYKAAGTGRFHRAVGFYGMLRVPEHWRGEHSLEPLDAVQAEGACPTMAIVGTVDQWTPPDDVAAAKAAGITVVEYEGADHGFVHDPSRPAHRADDARDAWSRAIAFLGG